MFLTLQNISHPEGWILSIRNLQKKTPADCRCWKICNVKCHPTRHGISKQADKQDRWCGQKYAHIITTSTSNVSIHKQTTLHRHTPASQMTGQFFRDKSVRQGLQSNDLANMMRHLAVMTYLIHLMENWNHTLNAWWRFLLLFLKGVYWICWLEEVMVRDKYGFLGQKKTNTERQRFWEDAKSRVWIILIVSIPRVPLQGQC